MTFISNTFLIWNSLSGSLCIAGLHPLFFCTFLYLIMVAYVQFAACIPTVQEAGLDIGWWKYRLVCFSWRKYWKCGWDTERGEENPKAWIAELVKATGMRNSKDLSACFYTGCLVKQSKLVISSARVILKWLDSLLLIVPNFGLYCFSSLLRRIIPLVNFSTDTIESIFFFLRNIYSSWLETR